MYVQESEEKLSEGVCRDRASRARGVARYASMLVVAGWRDRRFYVDDAVIAMAFTLPAQRQH
jgi:hypothetical protein